MSRPAPCIPGVPAIARVAQSPILSRLFTRVADVPADLLTGPIRGELLGAEHLAERARAVAAGQRIAPR
ncbi:MAG: hypothetical protein ACREMG_08365, partial [Gemmatimonadales bacterium]